MMLIGHNSVNQKHRCHPLIIMSSSMSLSTSSFLLHYGKSVHKIQQGNGVVRKLETALAEMNLVAEMVVLCTLFR
jgi:hypothetical protein